jgi:hypothetical protein
VIGIRRAAAPVLGAVLLVAVLPGSPAAATGTSTGPSSYEVVGDLQRIGHGSLPGLRFVAVAPMTVRAGEPVTVRTWWRDGQGRVYGMLEDWGDLGVGSITPPRCDPGERTFGGGSGHGRLTHTWSTPGPATVTLKATSGGCGIARQERTLRFTVEVLPARATD